MVDFRYYGGAVDENKCHLNDSKLQLLQVTVRLGGSMRSAEAFYFNYHSRMRLW